MDELEQARARIAELEGQVATLTGERDSARTELAAAQATLVAAATARRTEQIATLFGAEAELTDAQRAAYMAMTGDQFAAVEAALQAERRAADPTLFEQQARGGLDASRQGGGVRLNAPSGYGVDAERSQLHARATKYAAEHKTDYLTAVLAVEQGA